MLLNFYVKNELYLHCRVCNSAFFSISIIWFPRPRPQGVLGIFQNGGFLPEGLGDEVARFPCFLEQKLVSLGPRPRFVPRDTATVHATTLKTISENGSTRKRSGTIWKRCFPCFPVWTAKTMLSKNDDVTTTTPPPPGLQTTQPWVSKMFQVASFWFFKKRTRCYKAF